MDRTIALIIIVAVAIVLIVVVAAVPFLARRRHPRPADQVPEMRRDEPASSSDDPGMRG